ncbi:hypothetical protein AAK967_07425 [Atopobiaceae bacterium 24-176]
MRFHLVDPATGDQVAPDGRPVVAFLPPEMCGWWAMASLSSRLPEGHLALLATWDGWGEAADAAFRGIEAEAADLLAWTRAHGPLAATVGWGMGGQVATEAAFAAPNVAGSLLVGDVLCREVPGSRPSAWLTGLAWRLMGGPALAQPGAAEAFNAGVKGASAAFRRVVKRRRYVASQMDGLAIPRAYLDSFAADVAVTPRSTVEAMTQAVEGWRPPIGAAPGCRAVVATAGLSSRPYRESADALARALGMASLAVARDLSRNELALRYPARAMELLVPLLAQR